VTTVEQQFNTWAERVLPPDTPPIERLQAQLYFYAGAMSILAAQADWALEVNAFMNLYRARFTALAGEQG
jgi:hypothetical protein